MPVTGHSHTITPPKTTGGPPNPIQGQMGHPIIMHCSRPGTEPAQKMPQEEPQPYQSTADGPANPTRPATSQQPPPRYGPP
jgi:hypothetical protein